MKADKFLVTTSVNGASRKVLWDSANPISIDLPKSWVLENRKGTVWAVPGSGRAKALDSATIENEGMIELQPETRNDRKIQLHLRRLKPIRAAYLPSREPMFRKFDESQKDQLFAAFGVRKFLVNYQPIHEAFVAYVRKKPVFTYQKKDGRNTIKPLLDHVKIKFKGQLARPLFRGEQLELSDENLSQAMVMRGTHWWRLMQVPQPKGLSVAEMALKGFDAEENWFKRGMKAAGVILALLCLLLWLMPAPPKPEEVKPAPEIPHVSLKMPTKSQAIKKIPLEEKKMGGAPSAMIPSEEKKPSLPEAKGPNPTENAKKPPAPEPMKQKAAKVENPVPNKPLAPPKQETKKPAPPKPDKAALEKLENEKIAKKAAAEKAAAEKAEAKKQAQEKAAEKAAADRAAREAREKDLAVKRAAAAKAAAEKAAEEKAAAEKAAKDRAAKAATDKARILKESLGGLMKGGHSGSVVQGSDSGTGAADVFEGKGTSLAPTVVRPGSYKKSADVETLGGGSGKGGGGVSYGSGDHAILRGQGGSFVDVAAGATSVSTGLTRDEVGTVIHSHLAEIKYCYDAATLRHPGLEGKLVLDFTIDPRGRVKVPSVESTTVEDKQLERCVIGKLMNWKFPNPRGGINVDVSYPFVFKMVGNE